VARRGFLLLLLVLFVLVCAPLITPVAMGGVFAILFWPLMEFIQRYRVPHRVSAALVTLAFSVLVLIPLTLLVIFSARTGVEAFKGMQKKWQIIPPLPPGEDWTTRIFEVPGLGKWLSKLTDWLPVDAAELLRTAADALKLAGLRLGEALGVFLGKVPGMVLGVIVVVVSLYFFLVDGRRLVLFVRRNSFFDPRQTDELLERLASMARSVIIASVLGGLVQTAIMSAAMAITRLPNAGLVAFLIFVSSFVPLVGSAPVTFGAALAGWLELGSGAGITLAVAAALTSVADNVVRPWVLKGGADLHPLMGFVAAFGGLQLFGLSGLFLGPIIAGLFMAVLRQQTRQ
jgi:predicted PurR-regulated permease PerM